MYLLDTNVLSGLSPEKSEPDIKLQQWLRRNGEQCYLSAVTLTEIAYGVAWLRKRGATARAGRIGRWLEQIMQDHGGRILPIETIIALEAGILLATARAAGVEPDTTDAWIAATASVHGLEVLTLNMADFRPMGIVCRNPITDPPPG